MKKNLTIVVLLLVVVPVCLAWWLFPEKTSTDAPAIDALSLRKQAYETYQQGRFDESAKTFRSYLAARPNDTQATYDYAVLLAQLGRHAEAINLLENVHTLSPAREAAYFKLGVEYIAVQRDADALKVFTELQASANRDIVLAASEAANRLQADLSRAAKFKAETEVYRLAREFKHAEVVAAIGEIGKQWPLSFEMEMQRLYAMSNLQQYAPALERADKLAAQYPKATDLALLRANLLMQLGHKDAAVALWRQVEKENPGTTAANVAAQRLEAVHQQELAAQTPAQAVVAPPQPTDEEVIYNLAGKHRYREVVEAIDQLQLKRGTVSWDMEMQRLYSLQALGQKKRAIEIAAKLAQEKPNSVELAMLRADLLVGNKQWEESSAVLKSVKDNNPNTPAAKEAQRRLDALPAMCNLDKQNWGEMYVSGDYHDRYSDVIGSGFIRDGTYIPHARWLQPYVGMHFAVDTKSGSGDQQTIVEDNSISFVGGVRAQLFAQEYLFLYVEGGVNKDLLSRRHNGDWAWDYQAGIYGFKSWGPGVVFKDVSATNAPTANQKAGCPLGAPLLRADWFVDAGADFSWYHRYNSWLGYGQAHEGLRLLQFGKNAAFDVYAVENVAWDAKGNYFDNLFEIGPGGRLIWEPKKRWQVSLRAEWVEGYYFGRDDLNTRGTAAGSYDDFRVSLSVGATW